MNENINFKQYSQRVLVNESIIEHVDYDTQRLKRAAILVILSNQILNEVKREIFYKKSNPQKYQELNVELQSAALAHGQLTEETKPLEEMFDIRVLHAVLGLNTESAELLENIPKVIDGENLDQVNMGEELGDVFWYQAVLVDALGLDINNTLEINAQKLEKRYQKGFTLTEAVIRDLEAERKILEK